MLKLYGFPVSNYANMVNFALLEKGVPFEYVLTYPNQEPETLGKSPRGKVPFLETPHGFINETSVILEYLEDLGQGKPLLPADSFGRAQVRALMKEVELYIELPVRSVFLEPIFGIPVPEALKNKGRDDLLAGIATLKRHGKFAPYLAGDTLTLADVMFLYTIDLAHSVGKKLYDLNIFEDFPAAYALFSRLNENEHAKAIAAKRDAGMAAFVAGMRAKLKPGTPG